MNKEDRLDGDKSKKSNNASLREFGCPCGKTYLSYPALFTHVKQKHNGNPPGELIKPKTDKARGRPKTNLQKGNDDEEEEPFDLEDQIAELLIEEQIEYQEPFATSDGTETCQDMATIFLEDLQHLSDSSKNVLHCFLNEVKFNVEQLFGMGYWENNNPVEIIDVVNDMCAKHDDVMDKFPVRREITIDLLYIFFKWMYRNKWTDHKLIKKSSIRNI